MGFRFIHTADWQIGKAFAQFDDAVSVQLRAVRLEAIDRIASIAVNAAVAHVVVAGDVYDSELIDEHTLRQPLARMAAYSGLTWYLLPGNHDPARGGGVWERLHAFGAPANVVPLLAPAVHRVRPGVVLLPAPLFTKQMSSDPTEWMDAAASSEGDVRIGIAHGSVRGFGSLGEASVPIEAGRRRSARLDYLALGDWHGTKEIMPGVWYPGTPECDGFTENEPGHVLLVTIDGPGAEARVDAVGTGQYRWIERRAVLSSVTDFERLEQEIVGLGADARKSVVRLVLEGSIDAQEAAQLDRQVSALRAHALALRVDDRGLMTRAVVPEAEVLADPALRAVADRLAQHGRTGDDSEVRVAARAMRRLLALAVDTPRKEATE